MDMFLFCNQFTALKKYTGIRKKLRKKSLLPKKQDQLTQVVFRLF